MRLHGLWCAVTLLAGFAIAKFDGNVNYQSPSRRHEWLGIDVSLVERRSLKRGNVPYKPAQLHFTHGVASGDPWPESVILWTRVAPFNESDASEVTVSGTVPLWNHDNDKYIKADAHPICVEWKVFRANGMRVHDVVAAGKAYTTSDIDFTVKVSGW